MDRVFSIDDISDNIWSPPPAIPPPTESAAANSSSLSQKMMMFNRSDSEWAFQRFLQEASSASNNIACHTSTSLSSSSSTITPPVPAPADGVSEIKANNTDPNHHPLGSNNNSGDYERKADATLSFGIRGGVPPTNIPVDSEQHQAFLKSQLELACAAVALTRANFIKSRESAAAAIPDNAPSGLNTSQVGSQASATSKAQDKDAVGPPGIPPLTTVQKSGVQVRSTTSGSSRDESDEDEFEGEEETAQNTDPADTKRMRRMLSNRESARRSRRRKQAHLTELETQVSQLRVEKSSLLKRFADITHKYNEAAVDNRVLKADVETLRAKVKMAEETVKRVTGLSPLFQAMSELSTISIPSFANSPSDASTDAAVPVQDDPNKQYYQAAAINHLPRHDLTPHIGMLDINLANSAHRSPATPSATPNIIGGTSLQRVASLEHLQKRIRGEVGSCEKQGNSEQK